MRAVIVILLLVATIIALLFSTAPLANPTPWHFGPRHEAKPTPWHFTPKHEAAPTR